MIHFQKSFLTPVLVLLLALSSRAADSNSVTLDALVAEALVQNPELKFYEAEIAAARGGKRTAGEWANPELSAEIGGKRVEDFGGNKLGDGAVWSVSVAQTFEFPSRVSLRKAIAGKQIELAQLGLEQFRVALAAQVRSLGYKVLAAEEKATAAREVSGRFHGLLDVLVQRDVAGVAPLLERRIIEASALTLDRRLAQTEHERQAARYELNQLRGVPIVTTINVQRSELALTPAPGLAVFLAAIRERNFEVRSRVSELEQQGFKVKLTENERWPTITLAPFASSEKAGDRERTFGLGVTVPLPVLHQNRGNITTAKARQLQAEVTLNVTLREVERKIAEARHAYGALLEGMALWQPDTLSHLREAAQEGDRHYRLGALPIATYTELQKQYLEALDAVLDTQADALEARQKLELLSGLDLSGKPSRQP